MGSCRDPLPRLPRMRPEIAEALIVRLPGRPSRHRPRAASRRREGSRHARRDGARAHRPRPLRRVDPRRDEEPPCLLDPDHGHLRVSRGHTSLHRAGVLRSPGGKGTSGVRRDSVPLARVRRGVRAPLSALPKFARAPARFEEFHAPPEEAVTRARHPKAFPRLGGLVGFDLPSRPACFPEAIRRRRRTPPARSASRRTAERSSPASAPTFSSSTPIP